MANMTGVEPKPQMQEKVQLDKDFGLELLTENTTQDIESRLTTTSEVVPIKGIGRGCLALAGGAFSTLLKVDGLDMKLMSFLEKNGNVRRVTQLFNNMSGPFSFYMVSRPRNMQNYLADLDKKRTAEFNPLVRQQYWIEQNFIQKLNEGNFLTQRDFYVAVGATPTDLKSFSEVIQDGDEDEEIAVSFGEILKNRLNQVIGQDSSKQELNRQILLTNKDPGKRLGSGDNRVPAILADSLRFRAESMADQLNNNNMPARLLDSEEIISTLGELLGSATTILTGRGANPLLRIGGFTFWEYPQYLKLSDQNKNQPFDSQKVIGTEKPRSNKKNVAGVRNTYIGSLYVRDYPKHLKLGALFEIIRFKDIQMFLALQAKPLSNQQVEAKLKNRQQILWAVAATDNTSAGDMSRNYKIESIRDLRNVLARGDARLFQVGIRISVQANSLRKMQADLRRVGQRLTEMGFPVATALRNQRRAFFSSLPLGLDLLGQEKFIADRTLHPNMTGENLACLLPNCIVDASQEGGIILGINKSDGSLVTYNRWIQMNPHSIFVATSGAGKTNSLEAEIMRELLLNPELQAFYIDPQGVLGNFAKLVGGTVLDLGPKGNAVINPMDRYVLNGQPESIGERLTFLFPLFELMTKAELSASERSAISRAVKRLYRHFEDGESMVGLLEQTFLNNSLYAPLRPYLRDYTGPETGNGYPGIMSRLKVIFTKLKQKYHLPYTGLVRGSEATPISRRPVCHLGEDNRWYYRGDGEIRKPFVEAEPENSNNQTFRPALVWHPDPDWFRKLSEEFSNMVQEEGIFDNLDLTALSSAIRDSFVELKLGMPILSDLFPFLAAEGALNLVSNLEQYVDPEVFGKLFNGYTNVALDRRFISFNVKDLGEELLRPIRIFQTVNFTWGMVRAIRRPRMFVVDEFGLLVQNFADVGTYVRDLFMRGRAFYLSMTAVVQNITSLLDYQAALQCVENADRVVLLRQQKTAIHRLKNHFELTDGQVYTLLGAEAGEALELIDGRWLHVKYTIAPQHLKAFDTRPQETLPLNLTQATR
jgi:type IV secretory pathway VirB4 component